MEGYFTLTAERFPTRHGVQCVREGLDSTGSDRHRHEELIIAPKTQRRAVSEYSGNTKRVVKTLPWSSGGGGVRFGRKTQINIRSHTRCRAQMAVARVRF